MDFFRGLQNHFIPSEHNEYRPHILRRMWLIVFLVIILVVECFLVATLLVRQSSDEFLALVVQSELISLTNKERAQNSLDMLTENELLTQAAFAKAKDMAANGYFSHQGPDGKSPWQWIQEAGYSYQSAGENLAVRFVDSRDVVEAWMRSPSHRANIVKVTYTEIGMGVAEGTYEGAPVTFVVEFFATPRALAVATKNVSAAEVSPVNFEEKVQDLNLQTEYTTDLRPTVAAAEVTLPVQPTIQQSQTPMQFIERVLVRTLTDPRATSTYILSAVVLLVTIALALTFFTHIQIQHGRMLLGGAMVGLFALGLMALNVSYFGASNTSQSAGIINSNSMGAVQLGDYGYWISFD